MLNAAHTHEVFSCFQFECHEVVLQLRHFNNIGEEIEVECKCSDVIIVISDGTENDGLLPTRR